MLDTYKAINTQQTVEFVMSQHDKWNRLDNMEMKMFEVLDMLQHFGVLCGLGSLVCCAMWLGSLVCVVVCCVCGLRGSSCRSMRGRTPWTTWR